MAKDLGMSRVLAVKALANPALLGRLETISNALGHVPGWEAASNGICNWSGCSGVLSELASLPPEQQKRVAELGIEALRSKAQRKIA